MTASFSRDPITPPTLVGKIVAWVAFIFGVLILAGSALADSWQEMVLSAIGGLAIFIPAVWWFYCHAVDRKALQEYEDIVHTNQNLSPYLTEADRELLKGMGTLRPPRRKDRHWPLVAGTAIVAFFVSTTILGLQEPDSYNTCVDVWNDLGRPIHEGELGYARHLDLDSDGIGCEVDPR